MIYQPETTARNWFSLLKEVLKGTVFVLIFAIFPVIVLQIAKFKIEELEINQKIEQSRLAHERILGKIRQADDNPKMTGRSINRIFNLLRGTDEVQTRLNLVKRLHASFPDAVDFFVFNGSGRLIPELSSNRYPRRAMEFALEALLAFSQRKNIPAGKTGILKNIVGLQELPPYLRNQAQAEKLGNRKTDSHFAWAHLPPEKTMPASAPHSYFALIHESRLPRDHALKHSLKWINNRYQDLQAASLDLSADDHGVYPGRLAALDNLRLNMLSSEKKYENFFRGNGYYCTFTKKSVDQFIFIIQPDPVFFRHAANLTLNLLCLLWLFFVFRNLPLGTRQIQGGITAKLVFLFLFAIGSPSFLLMLGGYYALKDHSSVLQQELEKKIINKLNHFDEKFPIELRNIENFLNNIILKAQQFENLDDIIEELKACRSKQDLFMQGYLLDEKGTELFSMHEKQSSSQLKNKKIVILVARELLSRLNKSMKVDSGTLMMEATEDFFTSMLDQNFDFSVLIKSMGELIPMAFGQEGSYLYSEAIRNREGIAHYAVIFAANRAKVAREYIIDNINSLASQQEFSWQVNAYGLNNLAGRVITTPVQLNKIRHISNTMLARNAPVREIQASGSAEILWYAQRGAHLSDFALVVNTSLEPLKQEIRLKWFYLLLLAATLFIIAALLGFTLSTQFLSPIENLTEGVRAIEKRQFNLKIPVYSHDELGQLSTLLNSVLEGMKDLQVASIVQSSLFPSERLLEKDIEIFGHSRAMTDIGGDYFDYYVAEGSRIIGLVGDVSGHGVSAALIMGMAKYAFTTSEASQRPLTETLASFNAFLLSNIQRKKMMTMFLYCLNTETFELEYSNAGHNPPYHLIYATGETRSIEMDSFPLGIRAKSKYRADKISLGPGDKLLMYTDGLIETTTLDGAMIGYDRSLQWFAQTLELSAQQAVETLFARFDRETGNRPPEDDISLIVIRRLAKID